uniref:Uncharacterized protein n=1 Tax=Conchiformibius kuhniae TaxID=211502 RepID=A0A8T9MXL6_9NEIS|nr:hypothetical protein LVJ77_05935 [Conchiformibius kuhniae]
MFGGVVPVLLPVDGWLPPVAALPEDVPPAAWLPELPVLLADEEPPALLPVAGGTDGCGFAVCVLCNFLGG